MRRFEGVASHLVIAILAGFALIAVSGCDPSGVLRDSGERRAAEWMSGHNFIFRCVDGSLQTYTINVDGSLERASNPSNGEDCSESEYDNARVNTISGLTNDPLTRTARNPGHPEAQRLPPSATQSFFASLPPLPFGPWFPIADAAMVSRNCAPGGAFYVVNHRSATVSKFNVCPLALSTRIRVGSNPLQAALTPDGRTLLVTRFDGAVEFVDTRTDTVVGSLRASALSFPNGIAISPDGLRAYVTNYDNSNPQIFAIDIASRTIVGSVTTPVLPKSVVLTPDGQQLWLLNFQSNTVTVIDTLTLTVAASVTLPDHADMGLAFDPSGTRAYIATAPSRIVVLDTATLDEVARIPLPFRPSDVAVTPDGTRIIVNSWSDGSAAVIDAAQNQVLKTTTITGTHSMGLAVFR